jgi:gliding motility-associated-like protein
MNKIRNAFVILFLLWGQVQLMAQNLVPNPGFETLLGTPTAAGQWNLAQPWQGLNATPDLYITGGPSAFTNPCDDIDIPYNSGGFCPERTTGSSYMGLQFDLNNNYREYLTVPLTVPLNAGDIYRIDFYIQLADSARYSCNRIGALLTNNIPVQPGTGVINFLPQLETVAQVSDTSQWILITGVMQAAGGENYITLGVFRNDSDPLLQKTDRGNQNPICTDIGGSAYYYFDDIAVTPVNVTINIEGDTILCPNETTVLTADCNVPFWWSDSNDPTDTISLAVDIILTPPVPTTYYLNTGYGIDSVLVDIVNPPVFDLGNDTLLCEGDTILLDATAPDGILYTWSTGDTSAVLAVTDTGTYTVLVDNAGCAVEDSVQIPGFLSNPELSLGEDSLYCFFYNDTLELDGGPGLAWLWLPTLETSQTISILQPAVYTVISTRTNGCTRSASLEVGEVCEPNIFVPSAFSPDDDGINDIYRPSVRNVTLYNFRVLNRRGQTVFYSEDPLAGWDGKFEGQDAPIGVYVYRLNYQGFDSDGIKVKKKMLGTVTLIR